VQIFKSILLCLFYFFLTACATSPPQNIVLVSNFKLDCYLGKWYEIARLNHSFERGLSDVSAHYQLLQNGNVKVINRGYDADNKKWREATGLAKFIGNPTQGSLKVSFFWPFYGGYHIIALDEQDYSWAIVVGPSRDYLWVLARKRALPLMLRDQLVKKVRQLGIDTDRLIWVTQERTDASSEE
jgi:apolipoprotein D and lipocalin family protein